IEAALVNDLDLVVIGPDGTFHPWSLDPANPAAPAARLGPDRVNNIEQVLIEAATPGLWTVQVIGHEVPEGAQRFSLAAGPALVRTTMDFPAGLPELAPPGAETAVFARVQPFHESVVPGSPAFHYRVDGGAFSKVPMTWLGGDMYQVSLPALSC